MLSAMFVAGLLSMMPGPAFGAPVDRASNPVMQVTGLVPGTRLQVFDGVKALAVIRVAPSGTAEFDTGRLMAGAHVLRVVEKGTGRVVQESTRIFSIRAAKTAGLEPVVASGFQPQGFASWSAYPGGEAQFIVGSGTGAFLVSGLRPTRTDAKLLEVPWLGGGTASADFDGDGENDLALVRTDGAISVLAAHAGMLTSRQTIVCDWPVSGIAAADFDGDGNSDLLAISEAGSKAMMFRGREDGTFQGAYEAFGTPAPRSMTSADFNGDGNADVAISSFGANRVSVFLGDGRGHFRAGEALDAQSPDGVGSGDFNGDGVEDIAVRSQIAEQINVWRGDGGGHFSDRVVIGQAEAFSVADCDGDGSADVVLLQGATVTRFASGHEWQFHEVGRTDTHRPARWLVLADFDGDGYPDALTADLAGVVHVAMHQPEDKPATADHDERALVVSRQPVSRDVVATTVTLTTSSNPSFAGSPLTVTATVAPQATGKAAFYDGYELLGTAAVVNGVAAFTTVGRLQPRTHQLRAVYLGDSTYQRGVSADFSEAVTTLASVGFSAAVSLPAVTGLYDVEVGDLNGDGRTDLVGLSLFGDVTVFLSKSDDTYGSATYASLMAGTYRLAVGDLNGDGAQDVVVASYTESTIGVMFGNGDGSLQAMSKIPISTQLVARPTAIVLEDFNGDGSLDLAIACQTGKLLVLAGNGTGVFGAPSSYAVTYGSGSLEAGDVDHDGIADLVVAGLSASVTVLRGLGNGSFGTPTVLPVGFLQVQATSLFDVDGDGDQDIVVLPMTGGGVLGVLKGSGGGAFEPFAPYPAAALVDGVPQGWVGDLDGDAGADLVATQASGSIVRLRFSEHGVEAPPLRTVLGGSPGTVRATDINRDGRLDVITADASGSIKVQFGLAAGTSQSILFPPLPSVPVDGGTLTIEASATSGLPVGVLAGPGSICKAEGMQLVVQSAGECLVTALQQGNASYAAATPIVQHLWVGQRQTILFPMPDIGSASGIALNAVASSGLPVEYTSQTPSTCRAEEQLVTVLAAGQCSITALQSGDNRWSAAEPVTRTFAAQGQSQAITFAGIPEAQPNDPPVVLSASASSGLPVAFSTVGMDICRVDGQVLSFRNPGECTVIARQSGNGVYAAAEPIAMTARVARQQTISLEAPSELAVGGTSPIQAASPAGAVSVVAETPTVCTLADVTVTALASGLCTLRATQAGNAVYAAAVPVSFTIRIKLTQAMAIADPIASTQSVLANVPPFEVNATASSGLPVSIASTTPNTCTMAAKLVTIIAAGVCSLTATQGGNDFYMAAPSQVLSFTATAVPATLTLSPLAQTYTGALRTVAATTLPGGVATAVTYDGSPLAPSGAGTYTVVARVSDGRYTGEATGTLVVGKATPVMTWAQPQGVAFGTALGSAQLNAAASTAGILSYSPAAGTILAPGSQPLSVSFTPVDTVNYKGTTASVTLTVTAAAGVRLVQTAVLSRDSDGTMSARITVTNYGSNTATEFRFTSLRLAGVQSTDAAPPATTLVSGGSTANLLHFPVTGTAGSSVVLSTAGLYQEGSFSASARVTLPQ